MSILQGTSDYNSETGEIESVNVVEQREEGINEVAQTVRDAQQQLRTAVAEAVSKNIPAIVQAGEAMLRECDTLTATVKRAHETLENAIPGINLAPWADLGSLPYFINRKNNFDRMVTATIRSAMNSEGAFTPPSRRQPTSATAWSTYATAGELRLLPQEVLQNTTVQNYLSPSQANSNFFKGAEKRWSWVSSLGGTFPAGTVIPDFSFYGGGSTEEVVVTENYPHGWLTNLESALAMIGYFSHATEGDTSTYIRNSSTAPYKMFDKTSLDHLRRGGNIDQALNTVMHANHANKSSWGINGEGYQSVAPIGVSFTDDPSNVVSTILTQHIELCESAMNRLSVDGNIQVVYSNGATYKSKSLENYTPYSLLRYGGFLQQHAYSDTNCADDEEVKAGGQLPKGAGVGQHTTSYKGIATKLKKDAALFLQLNEKIKSNATANGFSESVASVLVENNTLAKLSQLLKSIAGIMLGNLDRIYKSIASIIARHRDIIRAYCQAIKDIADAFDADDAWYKLGDNWDDALLPEIAAATDALGDLNTSFVGSGQTSVMFKEQCFLLSFISDIASAKTQALDSVKFKDYQEQDIKVTKRLPYVASEYNIKTIEKNASLLMDGQGFGFLNKLISNERLSAYYNILNHELSNLQPRIRLWKVIFDDDGNEREVEIKFDTHFSTTDLNMFQSSAARGVGVGLKSFNFTYDGSNPFSVKKSIKANLKIFANTFSEILRDRPSHYRDANGDLQSETYKISDLAMKTWNTKRAEMDASIEECLPQFDLQQENVAKAELNFRLKAQVGISAPLNSMSSMSADLKRALDETFVTLNLTPTVHNFEFDEYGRVTFNLNFLAYIEQFFDQSMFNVFTSESVTLNRYYRELLLKHYNSAGCDAEQMNQKKEEFAGNIKTEQEQAISSLIAEMTTEDLIYYMNVPYSQVKTFLSYGPQKAYKEISFNSEIKIMSNKVHNAYLKERVNAALEQEFRADRPSGETGIGKNKPQIQAALLGNDPRETDLAFFYLSDLIDLVLAKIENGLEATKNNIDNITSKPEGNLIKCADIASKKRDLENGLKNMKKLRILLGPMELTYPTAQDGYKSMFFNLGDCPISVKYFVEWIANKMLSKDEVSYPLTKFVNDLVNDLIKNFLNNDRCFGFSIKQKTRLNQASISSFGPTEFDPITFSILERIRETTTELDLTDTSRISMRSHLRDYDGENKRPILNTSGPANSARTTIPIQNEYNFFVFFAGRTMPIELMKGDKASDEERGIFHYMLGRDRGLVKNIKLTKTQTKGLAEVRFEQDGYEALEQLRVVYDAQVDMFASVNTFPGTYIYIDPRGFAPEGSGDDEFRMTDLGIGGYYMIVRSEHEFAEGRANTILHTKWVNQIDKEADDDSQMVTDTSGTGDQVSRKCSIQVRKDEPPEMETPGIFGGLFG